MRGEDRTSGALFSYVDVEARIGANHPLRAMRRLTNAALAELDARFSALYEGIGRPSIPPERLLRATLLQLLYSIRSERQLVERLEFDMLFRWFVGLTIDERVFDASTFSKNRDRLLTHEIAQEFLSSLLGLPEVKGLLSAEHFSVDGTMLKAWASMKSFRPKGASDEGPRSGPSDPPQPGRNGEVDFRKTKRSNATHASTTDKDARLFRKGAVERLDLGLDPERRHLPRHLAQHRGRVGHDVIAKTEIHGSAVERADLRKAFRDMGDTLGRPRHIRAFFIDRKRRFNIAEDEVPTHACGQVQDDVDLGRADPVRHLSIEIPPA